MRWRAVIGIILIVASICGMYLWETKFRDELLLEDVIVYAKDIKDGEIVDESCFSAVKSLPENVIENSVNENNLQALYGMVCISEVFKGEQVTFDRFADPKSLIPKDTNVMVIPKSWVFLSNPNLKTGDVVDVYLLPEKEFEGEYEIVNVFDSSFEIRCHLSDFFALYDLIPLFDKEKNNDVLLFVLKES